MINIVINILMIYTITQIYEGEQKKKILATILIYGINMACDILSVYSFTNYIVGENYNEISAYITVLLICICEGSGFADRKPIRVQKQAHKNFDFFIS